MFKHPSDLINELAALEGKGSKAAKRALIEEYFKGEKGASSRDPQDTEFYRVVRYALDPWYNFFTVTVPGLNDIAADARKNKKLRRSGRGDMFDDSPARLPWKEQFATMFALLDKLRNRDLPPNSSTSHAAICDWARKVGPEAISVFRKILRKDLRCGMKASSFNDIVSGWVPEFRLSLAQPFDVTKLRFPCFVDPKFDGERCLAFITVDGNDGSVTYISRRGNEMQNYGCFTTDLLKLFRGEGCVVADCEVISKKGFQSLQRTPSHYDPSFDSSNLRLVVFDWIPQSEFNAQKYEVTQTERYKSLTALFRNFSSDRVIQVDSRIANSQQEAEQLFEYWVSQGLEGIIMKQPDGDYHFSTTSRRNPGWMKMKPRQSEDLEIVGVELGRTGKQWEGKTGSLVVRRTDPNKGEVRIGVASGLTQYMHENIVEVGDQILYTQPDGEVINIKGEVVEVFFDNVTEDGSLRFPRIKVRGDQLVRRD
jgi:hypothetical protein